MGRPRQVTDAQIDAAARETFVEHGPTAPVSMIARKLGVSHTALLQRAGSKEKLLFRALSPGVSLALVSSHFTTLPPAGTQGRHLEALLNEVLTLHEQMLPSLVVLRSGRPGTALPPGQEAPTLLLRRLLKTWLLRATRMPPRRAGVVAEAVLGAIEARCFNAYLGGPRFVAGAPRRFVHELVSVLVPELSSPSRKGRLP